MSAATPEFLAWTLAQPCDLKGIDGWEQPERAERHLRSAREYGAALREGRCRDGVCYDKVAEPERYFRIAETLAVYGGADLVLSACGACPANVLSRCLPGSLAGCFGELIVPQPVASFYQRIDDAIERLNLQESIAQFFSRTEPQWFGLWMKPIVGSAAEILVRLLPDDSLAGISQEWRVLRDALMFAARGEVPLHATIYPRGSIDGRHWRLVPYCVNCRAEIADYRLPCPVCGASRLAMPTLLRHARGNRPWRDL